MRGFCLSLVLILVGGVAVAELPLIPAVPVAPLPAPLPQVDPAVVAVEWADGQREVTIFCRPSGAAGLPAGSLAWSRNVPDIGTAACFLKPDNGSPTGWSVFGLLTAADGTAWVIPVQPWTPANNNNYVAVLANDETVRGVAKINVGG